GLFVDVPPGDYTLTLVAVDDPAGKVWSQAFLTLTPADSADVPAGYTLATRPAEPPPPPLSRYAAYTIEGGVLRGFVAPDGAEPGFDARATRALDLHFGAPLRVTVGSTEADAYFLADCHRSTLEPLASAALAAANPLVTGWVDWADLSPTPVLSF